jgi:hypothetical protein
MITKIDTNKIEHQPNTNMCVWDYYNLIESKSNDQLKINKMLKTSSKVEKTNQKGYNQKKKKWKIDFLLKKKNTSPFTIHINNEVPPVLLVFD